MAEALLILFFIAAASWLPGRLALQHIGGGDLDALERHFAALSLGLALIGWAAFVLAEIGHFSLISVGILWALAGLLSGATLLWRRKKKQEPHWQTGEEQKPSVREAVRSTGKTDRQAYPGRHPATGPNSGTLTYRWPSAHLERILFVLWIPVALWLFLRPHEAILGGADAGVYVSTAAHIARQGTIMVQDATLAGMEPALQAAVLRPIPDTPLTPAYLFPGFNVIDAGSGTILPDFFHYHPVWQAVAFALGEGIGDTLLATRAALLMPGLWAFLGAIAMYLTLRQALSSIGAGRSRHLASLVAMLALATLSLSAIQVWFARYPVTESLTQYLIWSGLWALGAWLGRRKPPRLWGLLAGLSLGLVLLTRIDTLFILAIPVLALLWQAGQEPKSLPKCVHLWFYLPLGFLTLHMVLHAAFISRPYFARITGYGQLLLGSTWPYVGLMAVVVILGGWLLLRRGVLHWRPEVARPFQILSIAIIVGLAIYGWFLRPIYGPLPTYTEWYDGQTIVLTDRENLVRLGWYLGPLGVWLGVLGACLLIWRAGPRTIALTGLGLFFSILFLWRIQANPHQIYVMRRYMPVVVPFFIAAGASLILQLWRVTERWRHSPALLVTRTLILLLAVSWLGGVAWSARGFVTQVDYRGLTAQLQELDKRLDQNSILLVNDQATISLGDALGTPLRFLFGHDVYTIRSSQPIDALLVNSIETWQNSGRSVYWVGVPDWLDSQAIDYQSQTVTLATTMLEGSYDHKPYRILPLTWRLTLNAIEPR